ncbi:SPASM domain-containing protein [Petrotoga sp. 9PWA.NaAc.5.4]|uniref:SPASM domain-containing protein n=1 Tax=Petrotoga sp. 9PWA.NaAc.5.4 TaxID=1434328 RepID=UPI000EFCC5CD|nr:SPASM domain-containing protein [Petrotoga sp. 9PWA.NaAc.5.4]
MNYIEHLKMLLKRLLIILIMLVLLHFRIENFNEILKNQKGQSFVLSSMNIPNECKNCEWYSLCRNGCKRYRYENGKYYYCESYKEFFNYSYS